MNSLEIAELEVRKSTKKERLKLRKEEKKLRKEETATLIKKHTIICLKYLDDAYQEVIENLNNANNQLLEMSNYLTHEKLKLQKAVKLKNLELIEELADNSAIITEKFIMEFTKLIIPAKKDSIAEPLSRAGDEASRYLNELIIELENSKCKNAHYVVQLVMNKVKAKASEYANFICKEFYAENVYMTMFGEALKEYTEYLQSIKDLHIEEDYEITEIEINNEKVKSVVSRSRLRCTHTDMMNFAKANNYEEIRQTNTTHRIWKNKETGISLPIPAKGGKTLPQGTMSRMLRQMNLTRKDLAEFLSK